MFKWFWTIFSLSAHVLSSSQFKRCMGRGESKKRAERGLEWGSEETVSHLLDLQNIRAEINQKNNVEHDGPSRNKTEEDDRKSSI